ncbi:FAD-binding oxidoreductase [Ensifer sp. YR511]|uniref:NAD(P)/FAD-dependent oxidoreductase n=1 Tax=Ensifer sp. YR511 TaxID=1855294 RepID=UPI000881F875|nr:FAD-dependent oxidoreductase [Ensifer sp. YR511]SDO06066.1 Glycine/D-amino acid oxidase [Ensifer sp. YR511]
MTADSVDFSIVGGGIVGMSIAYGLARKGQKVVVLDEGDTAVRASRGNFALVWQHLKGLGMREYSLWSRHSVSLWRELADELLTVTGVDVSLEQRGGFLLCLSQQEIEARVVARDRLMQLLGEERYPVEILDPGELSKMLPALGPDVVGGSYCPLDGHVNVLRLFAALHRASSLQGVVYRPNHSVRKIEPHEGGFQLTTAGGMVSSQRIVLAAGLGNARLAPMVGLHAPVHPERGQILVTEKLDRFLDYPVGNVRQTDEGGVMIGASKEDAGFDTRTTTPVLADLASDAVRMFPILGRARVVRAWSALRVLSPDECPIYEKSHLYPGAFLVTCHSGVTLAAAHVLDLAGEISAGALPSRFDVFSPKRFADVQEIA